MGEELKRRKISPDIVFGLARGGVAVATEVARILESPLKALIVRKIGAPGNPEFAVGAVAEEAVWWDEGTLKRLGLDERWQKRQILAKKLEISEYRRKLEITENIRRPRQKSGNIILVDDGAATGISMMVALSAAKTPLSGVAAIKTIVALPVASVDAAEVLRKNADEVVILHTDLYLGAVGAYYRQFEQVSWDEVRKLLESVYETNQKTN